ncbi:MAG: ThiF family adenylyltransferase [Janthinobacterium lividum]
MIWFLSDLARLNRERAAIEELERQDGAWLKDVHWRLASNLLEVDATIEISGRVFPTTLKYPYVFPSCPPSVFPRATKKTRWSSHQYGKGGELCLEWGADNWQADLTGADMLASAYRLLQLENPTQEEEEPQAEIPSRDIFSFAQSLRGDSNRFIATSALLVRLLDMPLFVPARIKVCVTGVLESRASVTSLETDSTEAWHDRLIPVAALDGLVYSGAAVHLPTNAPSPPIQGDLASMIAYISELGIDPAELPGSNRTASFVLFYVDGGQPTLVWLHTENFSTYSTVYITADKGKRLGADYASLAGRSVCIVGSGSLGAKIAVSLARAGVERFEIVDDDVFLSGNLVRHEFDWRDVGSHKVDALKQKICLVNVDTKVTVHRTRLNGQEASGRIARALSAATACDVIVDATADPMVFNLLAAIAAADKKTLVWAEVFAGGIGGLLARYSPNSTPSPTRMRAQILQWCADQNVTWLGVDHQYETRDDSDTTLIADDADVSVIAAHTTRIVVDALLQSVVCSYSHPAYLIGLKKGWIFSGPFDTYPIDVGPPEVVAAPVPLSDEQRNETATFIVGLLEGNTDAPPAAA